MPQRKDQAERGSRNDPGRGFWPSDKDLTRIKGDPGVGGLLPDPEEPAPLRQSTRKVADGPPSPDPAPPKAHGDWSPNRKPRDRSKA
jgi:hypothetical protein